MRGAVREAMRGICARLSGGELTLDEAPLARKYAGYGAWPCDAELALCVVGWALGPGARLPGLEASLSRLAPDFLRAAGECAALGVRDPALIAVGGIARCALKNAHLVAEGKLDPEALYWPADLSRCTIQRTRGLTTRRPQP